MLLKYFVGINHVLKLSLQKKKIFVKLSVITCLAPLVNVHHLRTRAGLVGHDPVSV